MLQFFNDSISLHCTKLFHVVTGASLFSAASSHSVAYTSDSNTTICVCYDDAATLVQPTEAPQLVSGMSLSTMILNTR